MRSGRTAAALAVALGLAGGATGAEARCAMRPLRPQLMTPLAGRIPRDGALLVGLRPGPGRGRGGFPAAFALERRRRSVALARVPIAPGLVRLVPEGRARGRYRVPTLPGAPEVIFGRPGLPAPPIAPRVQEVHRFLVAAVGRGAPRTEVRATLTHPVPAGVVAVVTWWAGDTEPAVFVPAQPMAREALLFASPRRCTSAPEGTRPPPEQTTARVAFVDVYGQLSPRSDPRPVR